MFVPKAAAPGARNTRRRQRTSSDDSVKPPKAKRQRSVLRQKDDSPSDAQLSGLPLSGDVTTDPMETEFHLPLRGSKQTEALKNDKEGAILLVSGLCGFSFSHFLPYGLQVTLANALGKNSPVQITTPWSNFQRCRIRFEDCSQVSTVLMPLLAVVDPEH